MIARSRNGSIRVRIPLVAGLLTTALLALPAAGAGTVPTAEIVGAASVVPTQTVTVTGSGFSAGAPVDVYFDVTDARLTVASSSGTLPDVTLTVPASAIPGQHWITLIERPDGPAAQVSVLVNTNWAEFGFGPADTHHNQFENVLSTATVPQLDTLWTARPDTNAATAGFLATPAVVNGVVYIGSYDHSLYAYQAATGALLWSAQTGNIVQSSAAVANGVVYVGSSDNSLYAFKASTGTKLWSAATGGAIVSSPTVVNGVVYVGSDDDNLYAFNASTGKKLWSAATSGFVVSSPAVVGGVVYACSSQDNTLHAFAAATGATLWSYRASETLVASPTVANGFVFVGDTAGVFAAFEASTGKLLWSFTSKIGGFIAAAAVANGLVYAATESITGTGSLYAFYLEGGLSSQTAWSVAFPSQILANPVVADGVLYVVDFGGTLRGLDAATGKKLWSAAIGSSSTAGVSVANGVVYVGDQAGVLSAFAPNGAIVTPPRARPALAALRPSIPLPVRLDEGLLQ